MASSSIIQIINSVQLGNAAALLYTSPSVGVWTQIMKLTCTNSDTAVHAVTIYLVPSGGSHGAANVIVSAKPILAGDSYNDPNTYGLVLNPGDALWGFADTAAQVNVFASGQLFTGS